jgi:hypothetical protein
MISSTDALGLYVHYVLNTIYALIKIKNKYNFFWNVYRILLFKKWFDIIFLSDFKI